MIKKLRSSFSYALAALIIFMLLPGIGRGQIVTEPFNYTPDVSNGLAKQSANVWRTVNAGDSILVISGNLSYSGFPASSGNSITYGGAGAEYYRAFTSQTSGTVYMSFLLDVTALGSLNATGGYTIGLIDGTTSNFYGRVWVRLSGTSYNIGINAGSAAANINWATNALSVGTTYLVVISYQIISGASNDIAKLWINPALGGIEPSSDATSTNASATDATSIQRMFLRQDNTSSTPGTLILDEIRVGTTWASVTPSSVAGAPTKLAVTSVNGNNSPVSGVPFSVVIQSQDGSSIPQPVTSDVNITLSGTGIGGTVTGTITNGQSSVTINGVTMSEGTGLTITATQTSGTPTLTAGTSSSFYVASTTPSYRTKASGNWSTAGTWEIQISGSWYNAAEYPNASNKNATILNTHTVALTDNTGMFNNLSVNTGGKVWSGSATARFLYAYGNITCDGTIGDASGTDGIGFDIEGTNCIISGSGLFKISRMSKFTTTNAITNLTLGMDASVMYTHASNSALYNFVPLATTLNITVNSNVKVTVPNASIDLKGCTLTLKSGASLLDNGTITNQAGANVTVERAIAGGEWHLISAPISDAVSGLFTGKFLQKNTESTNAFTDIESVTEALTPAKGFALYNATDFTAQYTGTLNTGAIGSADNVTRSATGDFSGWNLVGNPYPSSIDWNASSGWTKTNLNDATYIHVNASNWASYAGGVGANGGSQFIASGQGFFVNVASVGNGTLTMNNSIRVHNSTPFYKSAVSNLVRLQVSGQGFTDEAIVRFTANATAEFDGDYDAYKLFGDVAKAAQLYTLGSTPLAINTMPETSTVPVGIHVGSTGTYTIAATEINDFTKVTLEDTKTAVFTDLLTTSYTFNFVPGENEQRFVLHFGPLAVNETESSSANIYSYRQTVYVNMKDKQAGDIYIYNIAGQLVTTKMSAQGMNEIGLNQTGNYIVKVINRDNTVVRKVFIN
ncbi:MAG: T9SS type A sorting domain-containing protein [Bacteroidota bacterium]